MASPARTPLFLGIDLGTSSVKVVTLDDTGHVVDAASVPYPVLAPHPGWAETPADDWWSAVVTACRELPTGSRDRCAGVGLSGQMHGVVLADDDGRPLRPALLHADTRATDALDRYRALPPDTAARLANPLSPNMAGPMLVWLAQHEPDVLGRARWALQPKDWLRWRLTGEVAGEPSDASATLLYDVVGDRWHDEVVDALGVPDSLLPPLLDRSDAVAGRLTAAAARELGLPAGLPVAAGGGDTAVAALGSGLLGDGASQLTVGTGGQIVTPLTASDLAGVVDAGATRTTHAYRDVADGRYAMAAVLSAGLALDWVRRTVGATWPELYATAAREPAAGDPVFVPHLTGERTPHLDPTLRASWSGLALSHTREDLLRAALEGVAATLRDALDALPGAAGVTTLRLAGGGTRDPAWRQLLADTLDRSLEPLTVDGASSRGAAVLGALAAGVVDHQHVRTRWAPAREPAVHPRRERAATTAARRDRFRTTVVALRG